jgi:cell division protein FtsI/penicillin-binding protein 2
MMVATVEEGTARKQFRKAKSRRLRNMSVAAKTGTLSGKTPVGRYHWFIGAAPSTSPEIAVAALVIDPGGARINGTGLARKLLDFYFRDSRQQVEVRAPNAARPRLGSKG